MNNIKLESIILVEALSGYDCSRNNRPVDVIGFIKTSAKEGSL
jgi:hypothetical protein